ncbi:MAG: lytic murein transglycosylase, partial [Alphaproteobacteria bacterium]
MRRGTGIISLILLVLAACAPQRPVAAGAPLVPHPQTQPAESVKLPSNPSFAQWLITFRAEAAGQGIRPEILDAALRDVRPVEKVVTRDRNQAEFTLDFATYRDRVLTPANIAAGRRKLVQNGPLLAAVAAKYGVQQRFIVAIWGIETRYGAVKPTMPVIPALATLAYDGRRPAFFRNELMQAMRMLDAGYADAGDLNGSWAGAMGQPQFMPSSYMTYAQDWDGDGKRDIWNNSGDVFASIAHYLASHGWSGDQTWGREVKLPQKISAALPQLKRTGTSGCRAMDQLSVSRPLAEWQTKGVRRADGADMPRHNLNGSLAIPQSPNGPAFIVYANYESIL